MAETTYRALVPVRYLQILILFTKTTDSEDSWKKNKNPHEEEKKKTRLKHVHILYVVKIIWNHSFIHAAEASHHSLILFIPSKKKKKKKEKKQADMVWVCTVSGVSARGRWRAMGAPAEPIPLVQKPGLPCLKSRKGGRELREHW